MNIDHEEEKQLLQYDVFDVFSLETCRQKNISHDMMERELAEVLKNFSKTKSVTSVSIT